jgi:hypothetical protein
VKSLKFASEISGMAVGMLNNVQSLKSAGNNQQIDRKLLG